jgi:DNA-binding PadR family transcriptional regulator
MLPLAHLQFYILLALGEGEAHGWAIIRRIRELTTQQTSPSSGSLYLAMTRLQDNGLIEEADARADEDARRRYYRLTRLGRAVARAESARLASLVRHAREWNLLEGQK